MATLPPGQRHEASVFEELTAQEGEALRARQSPYQTPAGLRRQRVQQPQTCRAWLRRRGIRRAMLQIEALLLWSIVCKHSLVSLRRQSLKKYSKSSSLAISGGFQG